SHNRHVLSFPTRPSSDLTKPSSGCTGPPAKTRRMPATSASSGPVASSMAAIERSPTGRFITINRPVGERSIAAKLEATGPDDADVAGILRVFAGGPVQPELGFVRSEEGRVGKERTCRLW